MADDEEITPNDPRVTQPQDSAEPSSLSPTSSTSSSTSRLNARAPEYVPRTNHQGAGKVGHHYHQLHHHQHHQRAPPRMMQIHHPHHGTTPPPPPIPPPVIHMFPQHGPGFHSPAAFHGYGGGGLGEREVGHGMGELDVVHGGGGALGDTEEQFGSPVATGGGVSEDLSHKVTKQVEYYFSDVNLATTEHLMRFINKDPEGFGFGQKNYFSCNRPTFFVPISVIASFKKIKALVSNNTQLAAVLRTSKKLVVSDDGKKVRRQHPITDSDLEELQSRIIVAENLPEDHCYQSLVKVFSVVGSVKTIRTCYPQTPNGASSVNPRPGKMDTFLFNKLHAFVEYETIEQAERAVEDLNDGGNWRSGLRVRLLPSCLKHGQGRGRKAGHEGDGNLEEDDVSSSKQSGDKLPDDHSQSIDVSHEEMGEEGHHEKEGYHDGEGHRDEGVARKGRVRGKGSKGRGRGQHHNNNRGGNHPIGTPPSHSFLAEQHSASKPPGPRMPDGTRGFTMGRGKPLETTGTKP